ncbi:MAG: hypothetical protein FJZ00_09670, partial [Candidatus Sericytochromatia bacterium]|nr:hypothetical protein [Candidatus Tanganyikabacteria bacterium]
EVNADHFEFDIANQQAISGPWTGVVTGRGRFTGEYLFLSPAYAYTSKSTFSPCMAEDPGYFLSSDRFEWFPYSGKQHFEGANVTMHLSGAAVARVPQLGASLDPDEEERERSRGGRAVDTQLGYNTFEGAFATGTGKFKLAEGHTGSLPVRITQGRGLFLGTNHSLSLDRWSLTGDATYQTRYTGGTSGPRANVGAATTLPRGPQISVGLGYRSDLGGQAVHRLPELALGFPTVPIGPLAFSAATRAGYFQENIADFAAGQPDPLNPFALTPEKAGTRAGTLGFRANLTPPAWRPNAFWESQPYLGGSVGTYVERDDAGSWSPTPRHQGVGTAGLRNIQRWNQYLTTQLGFELNRTDGLSPFFHDRTYPSDLISGGITVYPQPRWSISLGTLYARAPNEQVFNRADLQLRLGYNAPCLSWSFGLQILSFEPFSPAVSFDYQVGTP